MLYEVITVERVCCFQPDAMLQYRRHKYCPAETGPMSAGKSSGPQILFAWHYSAVDRLPSSVITSYSIHYTKLYEMQVSRHIMISAPSASWMATASSGLRKREDPSRWDLKLAPSSVIFASSRRLNIWNPPLSVSIGRSQFMKRCRPPRSRINSCPGRRKR